VASIGTLQILRNNADGTDKGTLIWLMDHTHTPFGARLMRHWVSLSELLLLSQGRAVSYRSTIKTKDS